MNQLIDFFKNRKVLVIGIIAALIMLLAGVLIARQFQRQNTPQTTGSTTPTAETTELVITTEPAVPEPEFVCPLCGEALDEPPFRPIAVMIDNHTAARPHAGISQACMVIETLAEGGITRLEAFFAHNHPEKVGPVRSARPYFIEFALGYNALYAHCGGSSEALGMLRRLPIDLDQMKYASAYWRVSSRRAPHNLYTSIDRLLNLSKSIGKPVEAPEKPYFMFSDTEPEFTTPAATLIRVEFSSAPYRVEWKYDREDNSYLRFLAGRKYIDENTGEQIKAKNVAVLYTSARVIDSKGRLRMTTTADNGKAVFFLNGQKIEGSWSRASGKNFIFKDATGSIVKLNPGQTWIEILTQRGSLSVIN